MAVAPPVCGGVVPAVPHRADACVRPGPLLTFHLDPMMLLVSVVAQAMSYWDVDAILMEESVCARPLLPPALHAPIVWAHLLAFRLLGKTTASAHLWPCVLGVRCPPGSARTAGQPCPRVVPLLLSFVACSL